MKREAKNEARTRKDGQGIEFDGNCGFEYGVVLKCTMEARKVSEDLTYVHKENISQKYSLF